MQRGFIIYKQFITFLILVSLFTPLVLGQKKPVPAKAPATCSGAWTGNITYSKTITMADSKTVERVSNRGQDRKKFEMNYRYKASVAVLEDKTTPGSNIGKASIEHKFTSVDQTTAEEKNSCDKGKTWRVMKGVFETKTETRGQASGQEALAYIALSSDGSYSVGISLPPIQGLAKGEEKASFSGQCQPKEGKNFQMPETPTKIEGNSFTSNTNNRVDPKEPNKLSGSWTQITGNSTETIRWNLQKCGASLRITDMQFEDMKFPNWNDWQEITEQKGTIDGNFVKIKAKVLNTSPETKYADLRFKETYKGDKWNGSMPDAPLEDSVRSVRVDANSEETVEMLFDTSGYAWFDDGRPRLLQRIKTELEENGKKIDEKTENLKIAPKPLVLVHGLWSNWRAWETWQNILTTSHSYDWKAFPVGEKPEHGRMNTGGGFLSTEPTGSIGDNARELEKYIRYAQEDRNAWHVDLVAHSMGGLISRYYISQIMENNSSDGRPQIAHLVMLGTPNLGSPCADVMNVAFETLGKNVEAVRQLRQDYVESFNRLNRLRKGVKFSSLAGNPLPTICKDITPNDGVVTVRSAKWEIADNAESNSIHTELTSPKDFSNFVKPRLAIGPKGNHNPEMPDRPSGDSGIRNANFVNASFRPTSPGEFQNADFNAETVNRNSSIDFAKSVKIAPKQTVELEIPVNAAPDFGLTLMAVSDVSATLFNDTGTVVGQNLTKTPESNAWFRSIYFNQSVTKTVWKLKLENTSERETEVILATWKNAVK